MVLALARRVLIAAAELADLPDAMNRKPPRPAPQIRVGDSVRGLGHGRPSLEESGVRLGWNAIITSTAVRLVGCGLHRPVGVTGSVVADQVVWYATVISSLGIRLVDEFNGRPSPGSPETSCPVTVHCRRQSVCFAR